MTRRSSEPPTDAHDEAVDVEDVFEELEELEEIVDSAEERAQVRETMRVLRRVPPRRQLTRLRDTFDSRDVGEEVVGSFLLGIPMIVEDGTLEIGEFLGQNVQLFAATIAIGFALVYVILHVTGFEDIPGDRIGGVIPIRLLSIPLVAGGMSLGLMTLWGRVDWSTPEIAAGQVTVTAIVMAVGASLGDVLPRKPESKL